MGTRNLLRVNDKTSVWVIEIKDYQKHENVIGNPKLDETYAAFLLPLQYPIALNFRLFFGDIITKLEKLGINSNNMKERFSNQLQSNQQRIRNQLSFIAGVTKIIDSAIQDPEYQPFEPLIENEESFDIDNFTSETKRYICVLYSKRLKIPLIRAVVFVHPSASFNNSSVAILHAISWSTQAWLLKELYPIETGLNDREKNNSLLFMSGIVNVISKLNQNLISFYIHEAFDITQKILNEGRKEYKYALNWFYPTVPSGKIPSDSIEYFANIWKYFKKTKIIYEPLIEKKCMNCSKKTSRMDKKTKIPYCSVGCRNKHQKEKKTFFIKNIEQETLQNTEKGPKILYRDPSGYLEIGLMTIKPGDPADWETHENATQFIRVEKGEGTLYLNNSVFKLSDGDAAIIPAGASHKIKATTTKTLKLYTTYSKNKKDEWVH